MAFGFKRSGARRDLTDWEAALRLVVQELPEADRVVMFVLTGDSPEVLQSVPARIQLNDGISASFWAGFGDRDPAVLRRWGQLFGAVLARHHGPFGWPLVGGQHWPEAILASTQEALPPAGDAPFSLAHLTEAIAHDGAGIADLLAAALTASQYRYGTTGPAARRMLARLPGFDDEMPAHPGAAPEARYPLAVYAYAREPGSSAGCRGD